MSRKEIKKEKEQWSDSYVAIKKDTSEHIYILMTKIMTGKGEGDWQSKASEDVELDRYRAQVKGLVSKRRKDNPCSRMERKEAKMDMDTERTVDIKVKCWKNLF